MFVGMVAWLGGLALYLGLSAWTCGAWMLLPLCGMAGESEALMKSKVPSSFPRWRRWTPALVTAAWHVLSCYPLATSTLITGGCRGVGRWQPLSSELLVHTAPRAGSGGVFWHVPSSLDLSQRWQPAILVVCQTDMWWNCPYETGSFGKGTHSREWLFWSESVDSYWYRSESSGNKNPSSLV